MIQLTNGQIDSIIRLITDEIEINIKNEDDAYNYYWRRLIDKLFKAKTN